MVLSWMSNHMELLLWTAGGIGGLILLATKGIGPIIHWAVGKALANPKLHPIIIKYRPQIEKFFEELDDQVKKELAAAAEKEQKK